MSINTTYPIFNSSLYDPSGLYGPQGPTGNTGPTGPQGEQGPPGSATGLSTGAFIYPGKVSMDSTGSLASPAITFSINPDVGYCYLRSGIATSIDGTERFHIDPSGAHVLNGGFGIGTGPSSTDAMVVYRNTVANNTVRITNATGSATIALESTGSASNWVSFAKLGQFAQSIGIDTLGNLCISTSTSAPTTGSNAIYIDQSKVLNAPTLVSGTLTGTTGNFTSLVANSMTFHNKFHDDSINGLRGTGGLVITSSPINVEYTLARIGRVCTLNISATNFGVNTAGTTCEIDFYGILVANGWTINSCPVADGDYSSGDLKFFSPFGVLRNNGAFENSIATYINNLSGFFVNMRLIVVAGANFSGTNNFVLGGTLTWLARSDSL